MREFYPDWYFEGIGIDADHVHLHMIIPPKYSISKVVETMKSLTSTRLKKKFPHFLKKVYWDDAGIWARGFFVSTVGIDERVISRYVQYQGRQDAGQAKLELWNTPPVRVGFFIQVKVYFSLPENSLRASMVLESTLPPNASILCTSAHALSYSPVTQ